MMGEIFQRAAPASALAWTGERLTTETTGQVEIEHLHRYFFARALCRGLDVLDVASGEGYGAALLAQVAKSVVGVEIAPETVEHARAAYAVSGLTFLQGDARRIPCPDHSFDAVVSFETLEHFYEHDEFLAEVRRVLRPGGQFIISSPERDVYSPAGGTPNPYHARELTHAEFSVLLRTNFGHVSMYAQRPLLGSALVAEELPAAVAPLVTFEKRGNQFFEASVGLPRPIYLVAVASDNAFVPHVGSLYVETSGVEALFAASAAAKQEIRSLAERLAEQGDYAQRVQAELNRRDVQLASQVTEAQDWHAQLVQRNNEQTALVAEIASLTGRLVQQEADLRHAQAEARSLGQQLAKRHEEYDDLVAANGALLRQRADRYARHEAAYRTELQRQAERSATLEASFRARLVQAQAETAAWEGETETFRARALGFEHQLRALLASSSWRMTGPVRGIAARHPYAVARAHDLVRRHPQVPRTAARLVRGTWRALTLRSIRRPTVPADTLAPAEPAASAGELLPEPVAVGELLPKPPAPANALTAFLLQAVIPLEPPPAIALPRGHGRRILCVGHVLPYPPRAGNEYRIHRLLAWFADQGWDVLLIVCPLPHEMPSGQQLASMAAVYPNLLVCDRAGVLYHHLPDDSRLLDGLRLGTRTDIPALLHEDDGGDPAQARLLGLLRTFCPDALVELLLHLQDRHRPDLLLAEYVFMTRPFPLLSPGITTAIDTHDVFSTRAHKVERYGLSDGLAMSEPEEAALLRRADVLIGIQPDEARDLARLAPDRKVVSVGVDFVVSEAVHAGQPQGTVLLVASGNPMNVKGLADFLSFCWPLVRRDLPDAELLVVGAVGDSVQHAPDGVRVLGRVEDLGPLYAAARVVINPAVAGTGLKIKTVEALCQLRAVVCWPSGADGLTEEARAFCHIATDWFSFAVHIKRLLSVDDEAFAVEHARDRLQHAFSPAMVYAPLAEALHDL